MEWIDLPKVICTSLPRRRASVKLTVSAVDRVAMCGHTPTPFSAHRQIHSVLGWPNPGGLKAGFRVFPGHIYILFIEFAMAWQGDSCLFDIFFSSRE